MRASNKGFTLLELMIAMTIFSFMSIMAYGGLANVLTSNEVLEEQAERLKELQRTMMFLERDIRQIVSRPAQTGYQQISPAFSYGFDTSGLFEFTRAGNSNPVGLVRSSLQRVRYDLEEGELIRLSWNLVDHIDAEPVRMTLIEDVDSLELRMLDKGNQWKSNWRSGADIPVAVELSFEHKYWGKILRLVPVK